MYTPNAGRTRAVSPAAAPAPSHRGLADGDEGSISARAMSSIARRANVYARKWGNARAAEKLRSRSAARAADAAPLEARRRARGREARPPRAERALAPDDRRFRDSRRRERRRSGYNRAARSACRSRDRGARRPARCVLRAPASVRRTGPSRCREVRRTRRAMRPRARPSARPRA